MPWSSGRLISPICIGSKASAGSTSELLEASGVDTVVELSKRVPANLEKKMQDVNATRKFVNRFPP